MCGEGNPCWRGSIWNESQQIPGVHLYCFTAVKVFSEVDGLFFPMQMWLGFKKWTTSVLVLVEDNGKQLLVPVPFSV